MTEIFNEKCKIRSKGVTWGHMIPFWNLRTPLISRERLKLDTGTEANGSEY